VLARSRKECNAIGLLTPLLPSLIDQLTPDGREPDDSQIGQLGANLLRSLMK